MIAKDKVLVVDIDGTLCPIKGSNQSYGTLPVEPMLVDRLRNLAAEGWHIILQTSRGMRTYDGNAGLISRHVLPTLLTWLEENAVPYHEIHVGKPWAGHDGFYIDDRAVRPREFVENDFQGLVELCNRDRLAQS
jgi:capsule biosynthesis phosphatase